MHMAHSELKDLLVNPNTGSPAGRIIRALSERGGLSAAQLARTTRLAKSTVSSALSELRRAGIVVESAALEMPREASVGRPATVLTLNPEAGTCVGILVGLEHIQVIVADVSHAVLTDKTVFLEPDYSPQHAAELVRGLVEEAYAARDISMDTMLGVGIAVGAPINPTTGMVMRAGGVTTWAGTDIRTIFEPALDCPIFADNESNCAAIAEMMWGAARGHSDFVLFTIDLGVGGAIVSHGQVLRGIAGAAGEFGHIVVDPHGPLCRCGNRGCLEVYASFREPMVLAARRFGTGITFDDVIARAIAGDAGCRRLIEDTATAAGRGLGVIGATINPGLVVAAGRLVRAGEMFLEPLRASYDRFTLVKNSDVGQESRTSIMPGRFIENASCMGAVGLVLKHHGRVQ
jgi:predicted NBD/HSP70 family sugar kinase